MALRDVTNFRQSLAASLRWIDASYRVEFVSWYLVFTNSDEEDYVLSIDSKDDSVMLTVSQRYVSVTLLIIWELVRGA